MATSPRHGARRLGRVGIGLLRRRVRHRTVPPDRRHRPGTDAAPDLRDPSPYDRVIASAAGCATPKLDVRAGIFDLDGQVLLVRESADAHCWTLPGGWCDVLESPREAIEREVLEEAGVRVRAVHLAGVFDRERWPHLPVYDHHIYKLLFVCELIDRSTWVSPARRPARSVGSGGRFTGALRLPGPASADRAAPRPLEEPGPGIHRLTGAIVPGAGGRTRMARGGREQPDALGRSERMPFPSAIDRVTLRQRSVFAGLKRCNSGPRGSFEECDRSKDGCGSYDPYVQRGSRLASSWTKPAVPACRAPGARSGRLRASNRMKVTAADARHAVSLTEWRLRLK